MKSRTMKYAAPIAIAMPATVSTTLKKVGSGPMATAAATSSSRTASPSTTRRPGSVRRRTCRSPLCASGSGTTNGRGRRGRDMLVDFAILTDVSYTAREAHSARTLQYDLSARRPGSRPVDGRHHHADLPDIHLRPGRAGEAQGVRIRPHAESDAARRRAQHRGH